MTERPINKKQEPQGLPNASLELLEHNQTIKADRSNVSAHGLVMSVERSLNTIFHLRDDPYAKRSLYLAFAAHLLLGAMLFISVQWSVNTPPVASQAELWATLPEVKTQNAAVKAIEQRPTSPVKQNFKPEPKQSKVDTKVEPKPQAKTEIQKKPDITINDKKKTKEDKKTEIKPEPKQDIKPDSKLNSKPTPKTENKSELKPIKKPDVDKLAEFQKELEKERALADLMKKDSQRMLGNPTAKTKTETTGKVTDPSYQLRIRNKVKSNLNGSGCNVAGNPIAIFSIEQLPSGEIVHVKKTQSSGFPGCDDDVERAINKSNPLPRPPEGMYERKIDFIYKPNDQ